MANFATLLQKPAADIQKPQALPDGTYFGTILGYEFGESKQKKTPYIQFNIALSHASDEVDTEGLEVAGRKTRSTYYLTDDALWRLKEFLVKLGIEMDDKSLEEGVVQTSGASVMVEMAKVPNNDGSDFYNECRAVTTASQPAEAPAADAPVARRRGAAA